ncbi:MAG: homoserine O-acetyltransferase, partial [Proteobacteria bacterium]|nr:homoserine O-acetyltransferase [Pseudomonadota bacterium]
MTAGKSHTNDQPGVDTPSDALPGHQVRLGADQPLNLDCGLEFSDFIVAYQTYGELNADKSNAILVCHALTGDQFVAEPHPITGKEGWWDLVVGPGKTIDTGRYFVICPNVLGGCMGSS